MRLLFLDLSDNTDGVTMIEYALIAALISLVAIAMLTAMGSSLKNIFTSINSALTSA
jgi:pilus assembly protein Flp/PilA